jgi:hypothetical protein
MLGDEIGNEGEQADAVGAGKAKESGRHLAIRI